jgi:hypothetical protein
MAIQKSENKFLFIPMVIHAKNTSQVIFTNQQECQTNTESKNLLDMQQKYMIAYGHKNLQVYQIFRSF